MAQQKQLPPFLDLGGGLIFITQILFAGMMGTLRREKDAALLFLDGREHTITHAQLDKLHELIGVKAPAVITPPAGFQLPPPVRSQ